MDEWKSQAEIDRDYCRDRVVAHLDKSIARFKFYCRIDWYLIISCYWMAWTNSLYAWATDRSAWYWCCPALNIATGTLIIWTHQRNRRRLRALKTMRKCIVGVCAAKTPLQAYHYLEQMEAAVKTP